MKSAKNNQPWYTQGDPWVLTQDGWNPDRNIYYETIFTQSNGYMGIRGYTEESNTVADTVREGYLAGVFGHTDQAALKLTRVKYKWPMQAMITLPELFACEVELDGEVLDLAKGDIVSFTRSLNMRNGELVRELIWNSPKGKCTQLRFERFLSMATPHLAMQRIRITPQNWSGSANLKFELDAGITTYFRCGDRELPHIPQDLLTQQRIECENERCATLSFKTRGSDHLVAITSQVDADTYSTVAQNAKVLRQKAKLELHEGQAETVTHTLAVVSSRDDIERANVPTKSKQVVSDSAEAGYTKSLHDSQRVWQKLWKLCDVQIEGPAQDQAYLRFSTFSMLQMAPLHTDNMSVPARAYSYNRYHGLYYWDSETFLLPQYLHTCPKLARNLLVFRHRTLEGAKRTAAYLDSPGACFPWMTDSDTGTEQGPWHIGDYLWHQNADIAYAIDQYVRTTGDSAFMCDYGLEMILESARFWMSRLEVDDEGVYHLHNTVGPDEIEKHGKDNGFGSYMCRRHLRLAAKWIDEMRRQYPRQTEDLLQRLEVRPTEVANWTEAADRMCAPMIPGTQVPLQDEFLLDKKPLDFSKMSTNEAYELRHTHRVVKQSDIVMLMYLLQDEFTLEQKRDAYDFYEPITVHFSSLSYNTHSIVATMLGRKKQAYDYFMKAAGLDLDDLKDATEDGLHAAALGGTWQTVMYGFLGMKLADEGLSLEPRLPDEWKSIRLRLVFRGYTLRLDVSHDRHTIEVESREGEAQGTLTLNGEQHELTEGLRITTAPGGVAIP